MSCLKIFFSSSFGLFGSRALTLPRESSSLPSPVYGGTGLKINLGFF
jgi:hypothetical protein